MKWLLIEILGWIGIGIGIIFPALWLNGMLYEYGI